MISFKTILGFLFILLIAAIAVLSVVSYQNNEHVLRTSTLVINTHQTIQKADDMASNYQSARLIVNRIIILKDASKSASFDSSLNAVFYQLNELRGMTRASLDQQSAIDSLASALRMFKKASDSLMHLVRDRSEQGRIVTLFLNGISLRDNISSKIGDMKHKYSVLLQQHESASRKSLAAFMSAFIALLLGIALLLFSTFLVVRYNFNKRQRAQDELKSANVLFEKVFYESPIAIVISELNTGRILNCNRVFADIVNYDINDLLGKTAVELGIFQNEEKRKEIIEGAARKGTGRHAEVYIKPRNKEPIFISLDVHIIPLLDKKCLLTAILDLSTHKRAEDEIKKALEAEIELNKLKSDLVTLASHEFRTPLTAILSSAFLLENFIVGEHQAKSAKHLARIKASVRNLISILDEFLSVTKIEEGRVKPTMERIDISNCIAGICTNLQAFAKPGQTIHYTHSGEREVKTDCVLIGNIVNNLITNSIKYSNENSPIYVTSMVNNKFHLTVLDHGIGIPEADQNRLFTRFYRASNAGAVQGTGLGLHIMKHYVKMLNGSIRLKSKLGVGTEVEVTFSLT